MTNFFIKRRHAFTLKTCLSKVIQLNSDYILILSCDKTLEKNFISLIKKARLILKPDLKPISCI